MHDIRKLFSVELEDRQWQQQQRPSGRPAFQHQTSRSMLSYVFTAILCTKTHALVFQISADCIYITRFGKWRRTEAKEIKLLRIESVSDFGVLGRVEGHITYVGVPVKQFGSHCMWTWISALVKSCPLGSHSIIKGTCFSIQTRNSRVISKRTFYMTFSWACIPCAEDQSLPSSAFYTIVTSKLFPHHFIITVQQLFYPEWSGFWYRQANLSASKSSQVKSQRRLDWI